MSENIERIINYNIMKKYLLGILFILTIINMVESRLTADHENKVNLKTLLEASSASIHAFVLNVRKKNMAVYIMIIAYLPIPIILEIKQDILMMDKAIFALVIKEEVGLKNMQ